MQKWSRHSFSCSSVHLPLGWNYGKCLGELLAHLFFLTSRCNPKQRESLSSKPWPCCPRRYLNFNIKVLPNFLRKFSKLSKKFICMVERDGRLRHYNWKNFPEKKKQSEKYSSSALCLQWQNGILILPNSHKRPKWSRITTAMNCYISITNGYIFPPIHHHTITAG